MTLEQAIWEMIDYYQEGNLMWPRHGGFPYVSYHKGTSGATLDGDFTADELEAIAIIMRSTATVHPGADERSE